MPVSKYKVELTQSERSALIETSGRGKPLARTVKRALALLKADAGGADREVAAAVSLSAATVARVRRAVRRGGVGSRNQRPATVGPGAQAERQTGSAPRIQYGAGSGRHHLQQCAPKDTRTGRSSYLLTRWWRWSLPGASPWRRCVRYSKKRTQTLEEERVVHPQAERGVRGANGGCAGPRIQYGAGSVPRSLRPRASRGVFRRDLQAVGRGGEAAHQSQARTGGTL